MATSYEEIYNLAANKITDPEIALLLPEDIEDIL